MTDHVMGGISYNARDGMTPGQQTPSATGGSTHIQAGIIMDDKDETKSGRVWLYIPGYSAPNPDLAYARDSPTREPNNPDGSPGAPISEKRRGFIQAVPLSPHSGSDRLREGPNQPDGRNPQQGQSNSYGDFAQGRNGDMVAVAFLNGDPAKAYILGHIPKTAETEMIPGGRPAQTDASGAGVSTNTGPAYNQGEANKESKPASTLFGNLTDAGTKDNIRGSTSSSARETPSRVRGMKTPGDPDTMMTGHEFSMDDHPDNQLMRLRTSKGTQLLLCDTGDFIYMSTSTGKTWVEIDNAGNCQIYANSSVSIHAEQDFNMVCDRDFNLQVGGNANWSVKGDTRIRMSGGANLTVGEGGGDLDITTMNNFHIKTQGEIRMGGKTGITVKSAEALTMQSAKDMNFKTAQDFHAQAKTVGMKASDGVRMESQKNFEVESFEKFNVHAFSSAEIHANSRLDLKSNQLVQFDAPAVQSSKTVVITGASPAVDVEDVKNVEDGQDPNQADIPVQHSVPGPPSTSGPPKSPGGMQQSTVPVVPQHEPYAHPAQPKVGYHVETVVPTGKIDPTKIPT